MDKIKETFVEELNKEEPEIDLARAALLVSGYLKQNSEITSYLDMLDHMAYMIEDSIQSAHSDKEIIQALNHSLFSEMNFHGNAMDYYDPNNSFLNKVLDLRTGIPISLSVIYLEVGWRLNLPLWGIGMPGHFIVGYGSPGDPVYIDVFDQGRILTEEDCLAICNIPPSKRLAFRQEYLKPVPKKAILFRMLLNLKQIYVDREDWDMAYKTVDLMVLVRPDEIAELRDRGLLANRLNRLHDAMFDIKRYLYLAPDSLEVGWLEQRLEVIEEKLARLN